jgi:hypothetical protein
MRRMLLCAAVVLCGSAVHAEFTGFPTIPDTAAAADAARADALSERDAAISDLSDAVSSNPSSPAGVMCVRVANTRIGVGGERFLPAELQRATGNYKAAVQFYIFARSEFAKSRRFSAAALANP